MPDSIAAHLVARAHDHNPGLRAGDDAWTWAEVVAASASRAAALDGMQLSGPHVGVLLANVPELVFLIGGAALSGRVVVGLNSTRRGHELARDVRHTRCALVLTDTTLAPLLDNLEIGCPVVLVDDPDWKDRLAPAPLPAMLPGAADLFMLLFTSGSTGAPKAVRMTQGRAARTAARGAVAFTPADVLYCAMPLFHGNALLANLFPALISGASVVLERRFSASRFLPAVRRHGCTYFNYVGRALSYLLAQPERPDDADNPLVWCLGSEASPRDRREFRRRFGCLVVEGYSSTEGGVVIQPFPGMPRGALGRPDDGVDVAVIDPDTGVECPPARLGEDGAVLNREAIGEIVGRDGLGSFEGYFDNDEATAARARDGWYWTGDLAYRDPDGTFFFAGRTSDWLRVDGENFAAGPVEAVLARCPGVAAVAVCAVPDPVTGDQVMAALEVDHFDPEAFASFLFDESDLGPKWVPRFVRITPALPVTATNKVDRGALRAARWETTDPVWLLEGGQYRPLEDRDVAALRAAFVEAGREHLLL